MAGGRIAADAPERVVLRRRRRHTYPNEVLVHVHRRIEEEGDDLRGVRKCNVLSCRKEQL